MVEVKDATIINVSKSLYRTVDSFIGSSLKDKYPWNTGVHLKDLIEFVKEERWELVLSLENKIVKRVVLRNYYTPVSIVVSDRVWINDTEVDREFDHSEIYSVYVYNSDIPFSCPLSLKTVVQKMQVYIDAANKHLRNEQQLEEPKLA
jgi:hypothetical protein